jgi:hypothetical protein
MFAAQQYIDNIITSYQQATEVNLHTPERVGNIVVLTAQSCDEVMLTGDLHGHRQNFNRIKKIAALDRHPHRHLVLQEVCHGGPVYKENSGCMSHTLLEDVAAMKIKFPRQVHFLLGNHELSEMTDYPIQKNKQMLNLQFRLGLQHLYGPATEKVREAYLPFLQSCPLAVRLPHGIFVSHSIPEFCDTRAFDVSIFDREIAYAEYFERSGVFQLVWGRDYRQENAKAFAELVGAQVLINGHEPCYEGFSAPNDYQIILDCCGEKAGYVILTPDRSWTQAEIMQRIQLLK